MKGDKEGGRREGAKSSKVNKERVTTRKRRSEKRKKERSIRTNGTQYARKKIDKHVHTYIYIYLAFHIYMCESTKTQQFDHVAALTSENVSIICMSLKFDAHVNIQMYV